MGTSPRRGRSGKIPSKIVNNDKGNESKIIQEEKVENGRIDGLDNDQLVEKMARLWEASKLLEKGDGMKFGSGEVKKLLSAVGSVEVEKMSNKDRRLTSDILNAVDKWSK